VSDPSPELPFLLYLLPPSRRLPIRSRGLFFFHDERRQLIGFCFICIWYNEIDLASQSSSTVWLTPRSAFPSLACYYAHSASVPLCSLLLGRHCVFLVLPPRFLSSTCSWLLFQHFACVRLSCCTLGACVVLLHFAYVRLSCCFQSRSTFAYSSCCQILVPSSQDALLPPQCPKISSRSSALSDYTTTSLITASGIFVLDPVSLPTVKSGNLCVFSSRLPSITARTTSGSLWVMQRRSASTSLWFGTFKFLILFYWFLITEDENKAREAEAAEFTELCSAVKDGLGDKVEKVVIPNRISDSPCVLVTGQFGWSSNMVSVLPKLSEKHFLNFCFRIGMYHESTSPPWFSNVIHIWHRRRHSNWTLREIKTRKMTFGMAGGTYSHSLHIPITRFDLQNMPVFCDSEVGDQWAVGGRSVGKSVGDQCGSRWAMSGRWVGDEFKNFLNLKYFTHLDFNKNLKCFFFGDLITYYIYKYKCKNFLFFKNKKT
jgi:Hsp90 protein